MEIWIGLGVLAFVAHIVWKRVRRLEAETNRLGRTLLDLRAKVHKLESAGSRQPDSAPVPSATQPSLPFDRPSAPAPETKPEPTSPVRSTTPPPRPATQPAEQTNARKSEVPPSAPVTSPPASPSTPATPPPRPATQPAEQTNARKSEVPPSAPVTSPPASPSTPATPPTPKPPAVDEPAPSQSSDEPTAKPPTPAKPAATDQPVQRPKIGGSVPAVARRNEGGQTPAPVPPPMRPPAPAATQKPAPAPARKPAPSAARLLLARINGQAERATTGLRETAGRLWRNRPGLEKIFGAGLAVWVGGAALAMAGYFLVTYSIELGLVTPTVRMLFGGAFGLALLAGSEIVHRRPQMANGRRIAQALAGAGIIDLYAMLYIATTVYGLLPPVAGFVGLAATTAIALILALRLGLPTAVMGLVGGFATPAMVGASEPNIPVLLVYLFLVLGGLHLLIRNRGWWWLGLPATLGGFGWVGLLLASDAATEHSTSLGLFLIAMAGMAFATGGHRKSMPLGRVLRDARTLTPLITGGIALAQLAIVVGSADFGWMDWGLFGLLAAGCIGMGLYDDNSVILPPIALIVSIGLVGLAPANSDFQVAVIAIVATALFAASGYWQTWRNRRPLLWLGQAVAASVTFYGIAFVKLHEAPYQFGSEPGWAGMAVLLALPAAAATHILLKRRALSEETDDRPAMLAGAAASAFIALALLLVVPGAWLPAAFALQAAATALVARRLKAPFVDWYNIAVGGLFLVALAAVPVAAPLDALRRLFIAGASEPAAASIANTVIVYLVPALAMAAIARFAMLAAHRQVAGWMATILVAAGLAASLPGLQLPLALALQGLATLAIANRLRDPFLRPHLALLGALFAVAVMAVPDATPLDALQRLFLAAGVEPAAAGIVDTLWVYLLPAVILTALAAIATRKPHRMVAGWMATALVSLGLAASVHGMPLPSAYALQALAMIMIAGRLRAPWLTLHAIPAGILSIIAVIGVPEATPLDALFRLFMASEAEPAAAALTDVIWAYVLPALAMVTIVRLSTPSALREAAGWLATGLISVGLAAIVPGLQLPFAYALLALAAVAMAVRLQDDRLVFHAIPGAALLVVAVIAVPTATPLEALWRLLSAGGSEPAAASILDTLWVYLLPAAAMAAISRVSHARLHRVAAGWMATILLSFGLAASVPGMQLPFAYAMLALATMAVAAWQRDDSLRPHALLSGALLIVAVMMVPAATPLDAALRLFTAGGSEPAAAGFLDTLWVYLLPAAAMAAISRLPGLWVYRAIAGWMATILLSIGLAASVPGTQLPLAYALQALATAAIAWRWRMDTLHHHAVPLGLLMVIAIFAVPGTTPPDALIRLFSVAAEPVAASVGETLWVYLLPAAAIAAISRLSGLPMQRAAAGWMATALLSVGLAASVPGMQLPLAYALQLLATMAIARRWRIDALLHHAIPLGLLAVIALFAIPGTTPLHALVRLFTTGAEPAAAGIVETLWVYLLPAIAIAAVAYLIPKTAYRLTAAWSVTALIAFGLAASVPGTQMPLAFALQGLATLVLATRLRIGLLAPHGIPLGLLFAIAFVTVPESQPLEALLQLLAPGGVTWQPMAAIAILSVFVLPALIAAASAPLATSRLWRVLYTSAGVALAALALAAIIPSDWLPMAIALAASLLALLARRVDGYDLRALSIATLAVFAVQIVPTAVHIAAATLPSIAGAPVFAKALPGFMEFLRYIALPAIPIAAMVRLLPAGNWAIVRRVLIGFTAIAALVLPYMAVKSLFGINGMPDFQAWGFFERAILTQMLFIAGALAVWFARRRDIAALTTIGLGFTAVAFARLVWFDLLVFNPMLVAQDVGSVPVLNGLLVTYGLPILWLSLLLRRPDSLPAKATIALRSTIFVLVPLLVGYEVRQLFQGGLLIPGAVGTAELYGYSVAALATGIGFLVWGTAREDRPARLISLALVLVSVAKVFLYDASELTGLWRVAAFAGLGFSLLGISWFYTRYVFVGRSGPAQPTEPAQAEKG